MTDEPMSLEQALQNLVTAAYEFKGTRREHLVIEQSAQRLAAHLQPADPTANGEVPADRVPVEDLTG